MTTPTTHSRWWQRIVVVLLPVVWCAGHVLGIWPMGLVQRLDGWMFDQAIRISAPESRDPRVVVVAIDENSLADWGRWPWPRHRMAQLVDALFDEQGVTAVGFDMVFAESDVGDESLARALQGRPVVLGHYFTNEEGARRTGELGASLPGDTINKGQPALWTRWQGHGANQAQLVQAAQHAGHFNALLDDDGVVRSVAAVVEHEGRWYEALSLGVYRHWANLQPWHVNTVPWGDAMAVQDLVAQGPAGPRHLAVGERAGLVVPYRAEAAFGQVSASDLVMGRMPPKSLQGALVLIGATAPGLMDRQSTPLNVNVPGVHIHAHLLSGLMDGRTGVRPLEAGAHSAVWLLVFAVIWWIWMPGLQWRGAWALSSAAVLMSAASAWMAWNWMGWALPVAILWTTVILSLMLKLGWGFAVEARARRAVWQSLRAYFPAQRWEAMRDAPASALQAPLQEKELTVLFCDWHGFTALAEQVPPQRLQELLNTVLTDITQAVESTGGTVDKYMGDCVMAFWGAPKDNPHHASAAVRTAQAILAAIEDEQHSGKCPELLGLGVTIGIHTGNMLVGDMGSALRRSYTVIGDAVNVAARLQSQCAVQQVHILVSEATAQQVPTVHWRDLGEVKLTGRQQPVNIHTF